MNPRVQEFICTNHKIIRDAIHKFTFFAGIIEGAIEQYEDAWNMGNNISENSWNQSLNRAIRNCLKHQQLISFLQEFNKIMQPIIVELDPRLQSSLSECLVFVENESERTDNSPITYDLRDELTQIRRQLDSLSMELEIILDQSQ